MESKCFYSFSNQLRDKWRELPSTRYERRFSKDMLSWSDDRLLDYWETCKKETVIPEVRGWYQELYKDAFVGMNLADIGPGIGIDGIFFAQQGAHVTFVDIVLDNLELIKRICALKGINAEYYYIDDFFNYHFEHKFDVLMFIGSMHNAPFDFSSKQADAMTPFLRVGGRVLMLAYPKERYVKSKAKGFAEFGKLTDGERTPWCEWYDDEKILKLFGNNFNLNWSCNFGGKDNIDFNWFELVKTKEKEHGIESEGQRVDSIKSFSPKPDNIKKIAMDQGEIIFPIVDVNKLHEKLGFKEPINYPISSLNKSLREWKMEINDAPIFRYIYKQFSPKRHLEFGTWQGTGSLYCLEECDATIWTINLPEGEENSSGEYAYPRAKNGIYYKLLRKLGSPKKGIYKSDSLGFIGKKYLERNLGNRVCQVYCDSRRWDISNYPDEFFDTILIDGGHIKDTVINDTKKALKLLEKGGIIMWHDFCPPVWREFKSTKGVMEAISDMWDWLHEQVTTIFWINPSWILLAKK
jgi:predicted O-methyltransferase YrrM